MSTIFFTESMLARCEPSAELLYLLESGTRIGVLVGGKRRLSALREKIGQTQLSAALDEDLIIIYRDGFTDDVFAEAAARARQKTGPALFVGEHREERSLARQGGFDAAVPHPSLVPAVIEGDRLVYARVSGLSRDDLAGAVEGLLNLPVVAVHMTAEENGSAYVIASRRTVEFIREMNFEVEKFQRHDPQTTDLYLVRDDRTVPEGMERMEFSMDFLAKQGKAPFVVAPLDNALMVALPAGLSIEEFHFPNPRHGHNWRLFPLPSQSLGLRDRCEAIALPPSGTELSVDEVKALQDGIKAERIEHFYAPYVGEAPLTPGLTIDSRHIHESQNAMVTAALQEQLKTIGGVLLEVKCHKFSVGVGARLLNVQADLPGTTPGEVVVVSAHLDSIADNLPNGRYSPAPGGDDDASGMAGVLAAAEVAVKLHRDFGPFKRTLRFLFFNAEEDGVYGSQQYLADHAATRFVAVFQMDMIGFHGGKPNVFELHAGCRHSSSVQASSVVLTERVRDVARVLSKSLVNDESPQMYPRPREFDLAEKSSDHASFHRYCRPACLISEDHWTDPGDPEPDPQYNCHYHKSTDKKIDFNYAAEIARAVAGAAIVTAKG